MDFRGQQSNSHDSPLTVGAGRLVSLHLVCKIRTLSASRYTMTGVRHLPADIPRAWLHFLPLLPLASLSPVSPWIGFTPFSTHRTPFSCATSHLLPCTAVICGLSQNIHQFLGSFQDQGWSFSTLYSQHPESSLPWLWEAELPCSRRDTAQGQHIWGQIPTQPLRSPETLDL